MTPTPEQQAIVEAAVKTTDNLLVNALAGAAKTTTLELIAKAVVTPTLSLAFNKRIAEEMKARLPGHVVCKTMNALGHGIWGAGCARRLVVDSKKSYNLLKAKVDASKSKSEKAEAYEAFGETLKAISKAKLSGYVPARSAAGATLISREDFESLLETEGFEVDLALVDEILLESIALAYRGQIDFDDQIYMPTLFGGTFPRFPLVMVDEAQDLSPLNHAMLRKLVSHRLIAVGDPFQSIYAFRGAVTSSMAKLQSTFGMRELTLSVSFRCPIAVVERARFRAPHMQYPEWAAPGLVQEMEHWNANDLPDGAAIICRNNAPLFKCALLLLRAGRGCQLVGSDLGPGLLRTLKKLGPETMTQEQVYEAIARWESEREKKVKGKAAVRDKADCLRVFASFDTNLGAAIGYAEHLFATKGPIQLLSGHKAKGLEWDTVYHLDPWCIPSPYAESEEEIEQEQNVRYVIETRAKKNLFLVSMEGFSP